MSYFNKTDILEQIKYNENNLNNSKIKWENEIKKCQKNLSDFDNKIIEINSKKLIYEEIKLKYPGKIYHCPYFENNFIYDSNIEFNKIKLRKSRNKIYICYYNEIIINKKKFYISKLMPNKNGFSYIDNVFINLCSMTGLYKRNSKNSFKIIFNNYQNFFGKNLCEEIEKLSKLFFIKNKINLMDSEFVDLNFAPESIKKLIESYKGLKIYK